MLNASHRRLNILTNEWILVSPHRAKRPWLGQVEKTPLLNLPQYDPTCYLCPRNERAGGVTNPDYDSTFVFDNDFAALLPDQTLENASDHPMLTSVSERGLCRVVCFSPRHNLTLPEMNVPSIEKVITTWTAETVDLSKKDFIHYVQVFENKGAIMGCSNPHPHSQIWTTECNPTEPRKELEQQQVYFAQNNRTLLSGYLAEEHKHKERESYLPTITSQRLPPTGPCGPSRR